MRRDLFGVRAKSACALAAAALALGLNFEGLLSGDQVPFYRDVLFFFVPFKHFLA